jgi:two-component system response regulator
MQILKKWLFKIYCQTKTNFWQKFVKIPHWQISLSFARTIMAKFQIVIAEDDADDRYLFQTAFAEKGIRDSILFVHDGVELLQYLEELFNSNENSEQNLPYFILLDLNMPKKDGKEVLGSIKQHPVLKKIPVIVFTTTKNEQEINRCYELGANTYIVKPSSFDSLMHVLQGIRDYWFNIASVAS